MLGHLCRAVVSTMPCPEIEREEIMNACGVDDFHDGANVIRTACVVGMAKARDTLEPYLTQLGDRLAHIVRRMLPISMYLLQKDGARQMYWNLLYMSRHANGHACVGSDVLHEVHLFTTLRLCCQSGCIAWVRTARIL